jgi:hypothetical protein
LRERTRCQGRFGIRAIPIERVVGSVGRWSDFDRSFRPTCRVQRDRVDELGRVFTDREFPPVGVYELEGAYFVLDGHHRLALARERGRLDIDAEVTRIVGPAAGHNTCSRRGKCGSTTAVMCRLIY